MSEYHLKKTKRKVSLVNKKGRHLSEEHKKKISKAMKGKSFTEDHKKKISETLKGKPSPLKGRFNPPHSEEHKKKISKAMKGRAGKCHSEETRKKISEANKRENNPNWKGGIAFYPYPPIFNKELKQFIKDRDNGECQNPYCSNGKSKKLTIHHIDFNKNNCSQFNLITLCNSCNGKANSRYRWQRFYKRIVWSKYE